MATLNPTISTSLPFERPVAPVAPPTAGVGSALLGLGGALLSSIPQAAEPRTPTQDELYAQAWRGVLEQRGSALDPSHPNYNENMRSAIAEFIRVYPQFQGQALENARGMGIETLSPPQVQIEQQVNQEQLSYYGTPRGQADMASAIIAATGPDGDLNPTIYEAELSRRYTEEANLRIQLEDIERNEAFRNDHQARSEATWDAFRFSLEDQAVTTTSAMYGILDQMRADPSGTITLPPELAAEYGLSGEINSRNFAPALTQIRNSLRQEMRQEVLSALPAGSRLDPASEDYWNEVLAPLDAMINMAESDFGSLDSIRGAITSSDQMRAMDTLRTNHPDIARAIDFANLLPRGAEAQVNIALSGLVTQERVLDIITMGAADVTPESMRQTIQDESRSEASDRVTTGLELMNTPDIPDTQFRNAWTSVFEGQRRASGGEFYLGAETFNSVITRNWSSVMEQAHQNEDFMRVVEDDLTRDLLNTFNEIENIPEHPLFERFVAPNGGVAFVISNEAIANAGFEGQVVLTGDPSQPVALAAGVSTEGSAQVFVRDVNADYRGLSQNESVRLWNQKVGQMSNLGSDAQRILDATLANISGIPQGGSAVSQSSATPSTAGVNQVVEAGAGWTTVRMNDGSVQRREGTRAWRNNNPGNIEAGAFANSHGAVGTDGRFAVFPDYETGRAAKAALLFESPSYRNRTILGAINRYAPPFENDTNMYASSVASAVGVSLDTPISSLNAAQREAMLDAMEEVEGFRAGTINGVDAPDTPRTGRPSPRGTTSTPSTPTLGTIATASPDPAPPIQATDTSDNQQASASGVTATNTAPVTQESVQEMATRMVDKVLKDRGETSATQEEKDKLLAIISAELLEALGLDDG